MPRTFGRNQVHVSQVRRLVEADYPLVEIAPGAAERGRRRRIAGFVAERIPDGATIQTGIGAIPNAILSALGDHRDLGMHTELLSDGVMDLVERGVVTGVAKQLNRTKAVGTFALGTRSLYDFLDENTAFELWPVRYVNDPRVIATGGELRVDQRDDRRRPARPVRLGDDRRRLLLVERRARPTSPAGAMYSQGGQGFVVLHSTTGGRDLQDRRRSSRRATW